MRFKTNSKAEFVARLCYIKVCLLKWTTALGAEKPEKPEERDSHSLSSIETNQEKRWTTFELLNLICVAFSYFTMRSGLIIARSSVFSQ